MAKCKSGRLFCFTNFDIEYDYESFFNSDAKVTWLFKGRETCPTTGKKHDQGVIRFENKRRCNLASDGKSYFNKKLGKELNGANNRLCNGNEEANEKYCSKEGDVEEWGVKPNPGKRNDLTEMKDSICNGSSVDEITMNNPMDYHQYGRTLNKLEDIVLRKKFRNFMTKGLWLYGPTGSGKSHIAYKDYTPETHYVYANDGGWWDGYTGQDTVIINEFRTHTMHYNELLDLVDKWPKTVRRRNREPVPFLAKKLIICSPEHPKDVYFNLSADDKLEQLYRRFELVKLDESHFDPEVV
jgi:hypothetical protein